MDTNFINTAIELGRTVVATASDVERRGQPPRGREVELTEAWIIPSVPGQDATIRATARGYKGRFRVTDVRVLD